MAGDTSILVIDMRCQDKYVQGTIPGAQSFRIDLSIGRKRIMRNSTSSDQQKTITALADFLLLDSSKQLLADMQDVSKVPHLAFIKSESTDNFDEVVFNAISSVRSHASQGGCNLDNCVWIEGGYTEWVRLSLPTEIPTIMSLVPLYPVHALAKEPSCIQHSHAQNSFENPLRIGDIRIAIGSHDIGNDLDNLRLASVSGVLNVNNDPSSPEIIAEFGSRFMHAPMLDSIKENNFLQQLEEIFAFLDSFPAGSLIFVHCYAGISRSVATVMAYYMWNTGCNVQDATTSITSSRPCASPNLAFLGTLMCMYTHMPKDAEARRAHGSLATTISTVRKILKE